MFPLTLIKAQPEVLQGAGRTLGWLEQRQGQHGALHAGHAELLNLTEARHVVL